MAPTAADPAPPGYRKIQLNDQFLCEGAMFGDFNQEGIEGRRHRQALVGEPRIPDKPGFRYHPTRSGAAFSRVQRHPGSPATTTVNITSED
ncbi:MAG: hypothetical protein ACREF9_04835 [Opitutaceae bacterium]